MRNELFIIFVVGIWASACGLQEEAFVGDDSADVIESEPSSDESFDPGDGDGDTSLAGCSVVEWCNAPGGDGTRCQQTGCSVLTAIAECKADVEAVCGDPKCPFIFTSITGARRDLCLK